jgi:hypothetical protein
VNLERLRWGEWIAAIAALDLLLVTFRAWYKVSGTGAHITAWDALDTGRYLLIATAVVGIFLWLIKAAEDTQQLSFPPGWIAAVVGLACTIYIAYRLATPPADNLDPTIGLFLGLVSAFGVAIGGLLSAREEEPAVSREAATDEAAASTDTFGSPVPEPVGAAAGGQTWSPAAPVPSSSGWSPAAPTATVPPATAAGALGEAERPLRAGDSVVLTAGGARFPAGTVAEVVEIFAGGALVEVRAPDGMAERFEVPESAYERATAAGAAGAIPAGEGWSPAMPAPASEDWGFDDPAAERNGEATATDTADPGLDGPKSEKVPWWKREIGGGGKTKKAEEAAELGAAGALAAGAAAATDGERNGSGSEKPSFFKRLFGGSSKDESPTETLEPETSDVEGLGQSAEVDTAVDEPAAESSVEETPGTEASAPDPAAASEPEPEPGPAASAREPEVLVDPEPAAFEPEPEPAASEPEPTASAVDPEPAPAAPEPAIDPEPEAAVPEADPEPAASAPEPAVDEEPGPAASAPEPEPMVDPEPPVAPEPEVIASEEHAPGVPAAEPAPEPTAEEAPQPKRRRSSGSRKIPKEALAAATGDQPKVGDEVELMVGGGRFDAGTKGTVVDVFSAGVIVELSDDEGRSERLDLPFEAIGPADA